MRQRIDHPERDDAVIPNFPFPRLGLTVSNEYDAFRARGVPSKVRLWNGNQVWLVTKYDHVRAILMDNRSFSASPQHAGYPNVSAARATVIATEGVQLPRLDPPDHTKLRRMFTGEFPLVRVETMRPMIESVINKLLDEFEAKEKPVNFVAEFANALPSFVIAQIMGVPYGDRAFFQGRASIKMEMDAAPDVVAKANVELRDYVNRLLVEKNKDPSSHDDLCGRLLVRHINTGELSWENGVASIEFLLSSGHGTTTSMLALGLLTLLLHPEAFEAIRGDETGEVTRSAVEEMLRYHSIAHFNTSRVASKDAEIGGAQIKKGDGVLAMTSAANYDPEKFERPYDFDIARTKVPHLALGIGIHQCLGQALARVELNIAFKAITTRFPNLKLATTLDRLSFKSEQLVYGVKALPVTW